MSDATTTEPAPSASLYDIGAFLERGLNMTGLEARAFLERMRKKSVFAERDQGDITHVEADAFLDLLEMADRLVKMWEDDHHTLVVSDDGWSVEHSLACRASGNMAGCRIHRGVAMYDVGCSDPTVGFPTKGGLLPAEPGRYEIVPDGRGVKATVGIGLTFRPVGAS